MWLFSNCQNNNKDDSNKTSTTKLDKGPIIDLHLHADYSENFGGGEPICVNRGKTTFSGWDPKQELTLKTLANCEVQVPASKSNEALTNETLGMLDKHNIYAVTFGTFQRVNEWYEKSPKRIIPALSFTSESSSGYSSVGLKRSN